MTGVTLTPGQREVAGVFYDGAAPTDVAIWGAEVVVAGVRPRARVVCAVVGARGGKTYALIALRALHGAMTRDLSSMARGQEALALVVAPDPRMRAEVLRYAEGHAEKIWPILSSNADGFRIERPDGRVVSVEAVVATRGGTALRGRSLTDAFFDECAFFRDQDYVVNDEELFRAASPRVLPGGQIIVASTPWAKKGLLWSFYRDGWGRTDAVALVARAPTLALHDAPWVRAIVEDERRRNPDNAAREYDAIFPESDAAQMFGEELVLRCTDEGRETRLPLPGETVTAGADFGFERDSSALAVVHDAGGGMLHVAELMELKPEPGEPLKPSKVCRSFAAVAVRHGVGEIMADQHYRQAIAEYIEGAGLTFLDAPTGKDIATSYVRLRSLMQEGRIRLPDNARLRAQLINVQARPLAGGAMSIVSPRVAGGGHGDLVSALVCAVWRAIGTARPGRVVPRNSHEAMDDDAAEMERRRDAEMVADADRSSWRKRYGR